MKVTECPSLPLVLLLLQIVSEIPTAFHLKLKLVGYLKIKGALWSKIYNLLFELDSIESLRHICQKQTLQLCFLHFHRLTCC